MRIDSLAPNLSRSGHILIAVSMCVAHGGLPQAIQAEDAGTAYGIPELETYAIRGMTSVHGHSVEGYETPISRLRFQPFVEIQNRGFAEAQGDI
ncbi:MAG TPA: hypothetical protein PKX94_10975, partial [Opitutales bacterium]|nr:hypothetical protein [Opitutales bacterium]